MKELKKRVLVFSISLIIALIFWRLYVFFIYGKDNISLLRATTELTIHHFHYGIVFVIIASLIFLFYKINNYSTSLMGFGLGTILDEFIPSLFLNTIRKEELTIYYQSLNWTIILFLSIIIITIIFYFVKKNRLKLA